MPTELSVKADLVDKIRFLGHGHLELPIAVDYPTPRGDDQGIMPLELLLLSLATCSGQVLLGVLRKMRQPIAGLHVEATGQRRDENPAVLTQIDLRFVCRGEGLDAAAVEKALKLVEEQYCPVWAMLRAGTPVTPHITIEGPGLAAG